MIFLFLFFSQIHSEESTNSVPEDSPTLSDSNSEINSDLSERASKAKQIKPPLPHIEAKPENTREKPLHTLKRLNAVANITGFEINSTSSSDIEQMQQDKTLEKTEQQNTPIPSNISTNTQNTKSSITSNQPESSNLENTAQHPKEQNADRTPADININNPATSAIISPTTSNNIANNELTTALTESTSETPNLTSIPIPTQSATPSPSEHINIITPSPTISSDTVRSKIILEEGKGSLGARTPTKFKKPTTVNVEITEKETISHQPDPTPKKPKISIEKVSPSAFSTRGGDKIVIITEQEVIGPIFARFNSKIVTCKHIDNRTVECKTPNLDEGVVILSLSLDKIKWCQEVKVNAIADDPELPWFFIGMGGFCVISFLYYVASTIWGRNHHKKKTSKKRSRNNPLNITQKEGEKARRRQKNTNPIDLFDTEWDL